MSGFFLYCFFNGKEKHERMSIQPSDDRLLREQEFHDSRFSSREDPRQTLEKYYLLMRRPKERLHDLVMTHGKGKTLLDYGCATGESSLRYAAAGISTTGIDLSEAAIQVAKERARDAGLTIRFEAMNAEAMSFDTASFDVITGTGILHHLDVERAYAELARVLRDDGHALFIEALGHNPIINLFRKFTPALRSVDEHPLLMTDLYNARKYFREVDMTFYNVATLLAVPARNTPLFRPLHAVLRGFDNAMFRILPYTRRYAWMVLLHCSSPLRRH
jgi:ubiquinone/menaquinone biosynthesis C-methylase UbiE